MADLGNFLGGIPTTANAPNPGSRQADVMRWRGMTMSERDVQQTLQWVESMRGEALALEQNPRNLNAMRMASGLRASIDQAERLVQRHRPDLLEVQP